MANLNEIDKAKDKIRKLLNLANDAGAFEGEIENALRFARRMMLEHNVSEEDLAQPQDPHEAAAKAEYAQGDAYTQSTRFTTWEHWLSTAIVNLIGTVGAYRDTAAGKVAVRTAVGTLSFDAKGQARMAMRIKFYGPAEDVRDAVEMFSEWSHVIAAMARMKYGGCFKGDGLDYANGFTLGIRKMVSAINKEERFLLTKPTGKDLVLVRATDLMQAKRDRGAEWLKEEKGITLTKGTKLKTRGGGAFGAGVTDGQKSDFSRDRTLKIGRA